MDLSTLPLDVARLQRQLRELEEREERNGLALRYTDSVFEPAHAIKLFIPEDNLRFAPTPFTASIHKEMMRIVSPRWVH